MCQGLGPKKHYENSEIDRNIFSAHSTTVPVPTFESIIAPKIEDRKSTMEIMKSTVRERRVRWVSKRARARRKH